MKTKYILIPIIVITAIFTIFNIKKDNSYFKYDDNIYLAVVVNGEEKTDFPTRNNYDVRVDCSNASGKWNYEDWKLNINNISGKTKCALNFNSVEPVNFADYIISLADDSLSTGVYDENGYRYEGEYPNNWVWFNNEYWRIIGVFDDYTHGKTGQNLVKLVRNESIGALDWNKNNTNDWNASSLKALLNNYYYNGINESSVEHCVSSNLSSNCNFTTYGITSSNSREMIENVTWKLGGRNTSGASASTFYTAERGTIVYSGRPTTGEGYIGLMYPSDYGYAVLETSCARSTNLNSYANNSCAGSNWLYGQGWDWFLTPHSGDSFYAFNVFSDGDVFGDNNTYYGGGVRPSIYLKSKTTIIGGNGTPGNPYVLG